MIAAESSELRVERIATSSVSISATARIHRDGTYTWIAHCKTKFIVVNKEMIHYVWFDNVRDV